jgi:hypothetical protein
MRAPLRASVVLLTVVALFLPAPAFAWGASAHRLITNKAVDTLPPELEAFFQANRNELVQHSTDPLDWLAKNPAERRNHVLHLDHYGHFPFDALPRDYKAAVRKYSQHTIEANGVLPWQIGVWSERLTNAFRAHRWDDVKLSAAILAHFVAESHDPFNTTENFDGHLVGQMGVNQRFDTKLVDRYVMFLFVHPNDSVHIDDPTDHAFEMCLASHSWLEQIFLADRRARKGLVDYTDEYYDHFYGQGGAVLVRQITDAATDVGSYWLTSWNNANRPKLPPSR